MEAERRMAVLGGGPVGLACLLRARAAGWDAKLFERGEVGENVRAWGHVRMFSPLAMNVVEAPRQDRSGAGRPDELLTGAEYVEGHLEPLSRHPLVAGRVFRRTEVVAVSRGGLRKDEEIATAARGRRPFRLLLKSPAGERVEEA